MTSSKDTYTARRSFVVSFLKDVLGAGTLRAPAEKRYHNRKLYFLDSVLIATRNDVARYVGSLFLFHLITAINATNTVLDRSNTSPLTTPCL